MRRFSPFTTPQASAFIAEWLRSAEVQNITEQTASL
jgi:hypothetical protein